MVLTALINRGNAMPQEIMVTIGNLFSNNCFAIPPYRRSYEWGELELKDFLADLRQHITLSPCKGSVTDNPYFMGTIILHEQADEQYASVVDGLQRLTTVVIFMAAAIEYLSANRSPSADEIELKEIFVKHPEFGQKLRLARCDNSFFKAMMGIGIAVDPENSSARLLQQAKQYFIGNIEEGEWQAFIGVLINAQIITCSVDTLAMATELFEFQNRYRCGRPISCLEMIKFYMMQRIYNRCKSKKTISDIELDDINCYFEAIYPYIDAINSSGFISNAEDILLHHSFSFYKLSHDNVLTPISLVNNIQLELSALGDDECIEWMHSFLRGLLSRYKNSLADLKYKAMFPERPDDLTKRTVEG